MIKEITKNFQSNLTKLCKYDMLYILQKQNIKIGGKNMSMQETICKGNTIKEVAIAFVEEVSKNYLEIVIRKIY